MKAERYHVWLLSPYHSGSHRVWARNVQEHSRHRITLLSMAGRFWKWRMQGGAVELAALARRLLVEEGAPDAVLATDMVNLLAWLGLLRKDLPGDTPVLLYMHENQLTYPWRPGEKKDLTYAMINWLSQVAADEVWFNSSYHRESWFDELPRFLKHYPDYNHFELMESVRKRSHVAPVGINCQTFTAASSSSGEGSSPQGDSSTPPLIIWNQRWEYDKRPDRFFALLYRLREAGVSFRLAVAGENFRNVPAEFEEARTRLAGQVEHWGFVESRRQYADLLRRASLVVSTADHEFFGISILEAICAGAFPLLPARLAYPELIPDDLHPACLYTNEQDLFDKAVLRLTQPRPAPPSLLQHIAQQYDWPVVARRYDDGVAAVVEGRTTPHPLGLSS